MKTMLSLILLFTIALPASSQACSCAALPVEEQFELAEYVFQAEVISAKLIGSTRIEIDDMFEKIVSSGDRIEISFDPIRNFKGESSDLPHLYTVRDQMSCGVTIWVGGFYVFFVNSDGEVSLCSGTFCEYAPHNNNKTKEKFDKIMELSGTTIP